MSDNQYVFEIIRDLGYLVQDLKESEIVWMHVKNDGNGFYTARSSKGIPHGLSETSFAIEKAYKVTRGKPDERDVLIAELKNTRTSLTLNEVLEVVDQNVDWQEEDIEKEVKQALIKRFGEVEAIPNDR